MPSDYREIGNEIFKKLEPDPTRLGEALSLLSKVVRGRLESGAWDEVLTRCESAYELCHEVQGSEELREWSNVIDTAHAEGILHAYEGISHLYQAEAAREKKDRSEVREELAKAVDCLEKSQQSFHFFEYRDQWNEGIIWLSLGRLYRNQNKLNEALLVFRRSLYIFDRLSVEKRQKIVPVVLEEIEETRRLLGPKPEDSGGQEDETAQQHREKHSEASPVDQKPFAPHGLERLSPPTQQKVVAFRVLPVIDEIGAGREKPVSDEHIIGHIQQTDELVFGIEGRELEVKLLKGTRPPLFLPGYDYVAVRVSGDSMDKAGIASNDYVILRKSKPDSSGDIVAVVFRNEDDKATLKRFHFDKSSGSVTLKPESSNPEYKTRVLRPEAFAGDNLSVEVVGIAIAVLKPRGQYG